MLPSDRLLVQRLMIAASLRSISRKIPRESKGVCDVSSACLHELLDIPGQGVAKAVLNGVRRVKSQKSPGLADIRLQAIATNGREVAAMKLKLSFC
jgi:hypothetical protein